MISGLLSPSHIHKHTHTFFDLLLCASVLGELLSCGMNAGPNLHFPLPPSQPQLCLCTIVHIVIATLKTSEV